MSELHPQFIQETARLKSEGWQNIGYARTTWFFRRGNKIKCCDMVTGESSEWTAGLSINQLINKNRSEQ